MCIPIRNRASRKINIVLKSFVYVFFPLFYFGTRKTRRIAVAKETPVDHSVGQLLFPRAASGIYTGNGPLRARIAFQLFRAH